MDTSDNKEDSSVPPRGEPDTPSSGAPTPGRRTRGRVARTHLVRKTPVKSMKSKVVPIIQPHPVNGSLTPQEAEFIQDLTHPLSPTFLKPKEAHQMAYPADPVSGAPSRIARTLAKPAVNATLKNILDTPEVKAKLEEGVNSVLEDAQHTKYRVKDWLDAARFWAEVTGNKAPDKIVAIPFSTEDREARYREVLAKVRREQPDEVVLDTPQTHQDAPGGTK